MTQPIDVAYVDIIARTKEFRKDIKDLIDNEVDKLDDALTDVLDDVDKHFAETAKKADDALRDVENSTKRTSSRIKDTLKDSFDFDRDKRGLFSGIGDVTGNMWRSLQQNLSGVGSAFSTIFSAVPQAFSMLFSLPALIAALLVLLPGFIGLLIALGAALSNLVNLVGFLPGGLAVLAAVIAPLVIGFQNFGEAIGAILEKDPEKINEALLKLAPAARSVAREFQAIVPLFTQLQKIVQQSLFAPLVGDLTRLVKALILPLTGGLSRVAGVIGLIISGIIDTIASPSGINTINQVFLATEAILRTLGPALIQLFGAFLPLIRATLPFLERLSGKFAEALVKFADFITKSVEDGSFDLFLSEGLLILGQLFDLLVAVGGLLGTIFSSETTEGGTDIILMFTQFFDTLTKFFQSTEGKQFLADLTTLAKATAIAVMALIVFIGFLLQILTTTLTVVLDFFGLVDRTVISTKDGITSAMTAIVDVIAQVPGKLMALGTFFADAGRNLIQSFIGGFRQAGSFVTDVAGDIVQGIKGGLNRFIATINLGIANIDAMLPFSIGRIPKLADGALIHHRPGGILANIGEGHEDEVVSPLSDLKAMIADAGGPRITFEPGAINVNFEGVVPTEGEARTVGTAVGQGIIATLARRGVNTQVRAA